MLVDTNLMEVILIAATSLVGMFGLGMGLEGFFRGKLPWWLRIVAIGGGLCLIYPGTLTDVIGVCVVAAVIALQLLRQKNTGAAAAA